MKLKKLIGVMAVAGFVLPGAAHATYGYFSHGYGMKAKGMAGASTAMTVDTFGGANNPASMVWVGNRMDVGVDWFRPIRSAERTGAGDTTMNGSADSGSKDFLIPEFGYNRMLDNNMSLGVTVYGNGGMNTNYSGGQLGYGGTCGNGGGTGFSLTQTAGTTYNLLCGTGNLGVDLMQLIIAPTFAYKVNASNSVGVSPLLGYQRFKAEGLQGFHGYKSVPGSTDGLTNQGYDDATGFGVRLGWLGKLSDQISVGAAYSSKIDMSKFDKYKNLFAEQGDFDLPENYNIGVAFKATKDVTVAVDYQRINYSGVKSIANASTLGGSTTVGTLGGNDGRGFGWGDVDVWKIGLEYQYSSNLVVRAGYGKSDNPIQARDVTFNMIAPGVVEDHYTLGFTYTLDKSSELTVSYMHAAENSVSGSSLFNTWTSNTSGTEKIKMYQDSLGVAYGMKF